MARAVMALLLTLILGGCINPEEKDEDRTGSPFEPDPNTGLIVTGFDAPEPSLGFTQDEALFIIARNNVLRSHDMGATWEIVHQYSGMSQLPIGSNTTEDPMLWVDPITDRVWVNHLYFAGPLRSCTALFWTDDQGASWTERDAACGTPQVDHQWLASGPPGPEDPLPTAGFEIVGYPTILHMCYNKVYAVITPVSYDEATRATACTMSRDGGLTWTPDQPVIDARLHDCTGGFSSRPAISDDGVVAVASSYGCPRPTVAISRDSGQSWEVHQLDSAPAPMAEVNTPEVAFDNAGRLYLTYTAEDQHTYLIRSDDEGSSWSEAWDVTPPDWKGTIFPVVVAGSEGHIAIALHANQEWAGGPSEAPPDTRWHTWWIFSPDADSSTPTFDFHRATPLDAPTQIGCIHRKFSESPCRNLRDFMDSAVAPDGRPFLAFTKGCTSGCEGNPSAREDASRSQQLALSWLNRTL